MKVAVAVITDREQRVLITQRSLHVPHGGCWEFPGGKIEPDESPQQALVREIKEELGITVVDSVFLGEVTHQYPNQMIHLIIFHVSRFTGEPFCKEGQLNMKWVHKDKLSDEDFPQANRDIINMIQQTSQHALN
ncbi:8-oxo-dGTP diphosphatase MutT [Legionella worsleiensis]|uniref:8-oxo-dGTP diphosphatase n=1 Tax=Legionella worsleiensis TaxID=45076 RepID=A0A0W1A747_9GAMM|nr:8-oxo-dGTP diphosphatase MutT [Legionella worsleiensis]KTD76867.1 Mutator protein MutT [Legionella worsleiensis]STY33464.1 mutator MutT protein [Legionella worsleiensis]